MTAEGEEVISVASSCCVLMSSSANNFIKLQLQNPSFEQKLIYIVMILGVSMISIADAYHICASMSNCFRGISARP